MIHHTRGVYRDGSFKDNGVLPENLKSHIDYNLTMRPGRAFFVDGKCLNRGYLSEAECAAAEKALIGVTAKKDTAPYR